MGLPSNEPSKVPFMGLKCSVNGLSMFPEWAWNIPWVRALNSTIQYAHTENIQGFGSNMHAQGTSFRGSDSGNIEGSFRDNDPMPK
jgi:hypothetical protein